LKDDTIFSEALAGFTILEDKTWWVMDRKYSAAIQAYEKVVADS